MASKRTKTTTKKKQSKTAAKKTKTTKPKTTKTTKATKKPAAKPKPRADYGQPIEAFFAKQPPALRAILDVLRALVEEAAPQATSSIKWGMPFYQVAGETLCALGAHKQHVNLILSGPPGTFTDPQGLLIGDGKTGKHLKLTRVDDVPKAQVRTWLKQALAR